MQSPMQIGAGRACYLVAPRKHAQQVETPWADIRAIPEEGIPRKKFIPDMKRQRKYALSSKGNE